MRNNQCRIWTAEERQTINEMMKMHHAISKFACSTDSDKLFKMMDLSTKEHFLTVNLFLTDTNGQRLPPSHRFVFDIKEKTVEMMGSTVYKFSPWWKRQYQSHTFYFDDIGDSGLDAVVKSIFESGFNIRRFESDLSK